jgi:hypothetical protein
MIKLFLILFLMPFTAQTQYWQTVPIGFFNNIWNLEWNKGDSYTRNSQHFKINKYDNSIWSLSDNRVVRLDEGGTFQLWDQNNTILFQLGDSYTDINFTSTHTFVVSQFTNLYKFDGSMWNVMSATDKGINLAVDSDTLWLSRQGEDYLRIVNATNISFGTFHADRVESKNGTTFIGTSPFGGSILQMNEPNFDLYLTSTSPYYLDYKNYDFKFSPYSDTFFTSGDRGFSLAVNGVFVDTITKFNTTNMPDLAITEFEFDSQGNIWAVFGPVPFGSLYYTEIIGYLDRTTNNWSQFYDGSNSPINFSNHRVTIELDSNGNLWVANGQNLHVLGLGTSPAWLGNEELKNNGTFVNVYPNPSSGKINISSNVSIREIIVYDAFGQEVLKSTSIDGIILPKGLFIVQVVSEKGEIFSEKVVVE